MKYLTAEEILLIHSMILGETGGAHGLRDPGLLASAVSRPQMAFGGKELYPDIFTKAAVYLDSLAKHHVFVDGNKRTAMSAAIVFLEDNGTGFVAVEGEIERFILKVIGDKLDITTIAAWLKRHSRKARK